MKNLLALFGTLSILAACGDSGTGGSGGDGGSGGVGGDGGSAGATVEPVCSEPVAVPCEDEVILGMNLKTTVSPTNITNEPDGDGFASLIDATAGGPFNADPPSHTYGKFTENGLEKVEINDEDALTSMDWDISFRRYVGRINSGNSGPSCVSAARLPGEPDYDTISSAEEGLTYRTDEYFTDTCEIIADGTGLEGSPATALSSYWTYPGCVQMTDNVYIVRLADGRTLKLTVTNFYDEAAQESCDSSGSVPMGDTGSGNIRVRWAFLP